MSAVDPGCVKTRTRQRSTNYLYNITSIHREISDIDSPTRNKIAPTSDPSAFSQNQDSQRTSPATAGRNAAGLLVARGDTAMYLFRACERDDAPRLPIPVTGRSSYKEGTTCSNRQRPLTCAASPVIRTARRSPRRTDLGPLRGRSPRMSPGPWTSTDPSWSSGSRGMASIFGDRSLSTLQPSPSSRATVWRARRCSTFEDTGSAPSSGC